ncbi:hypothetical protein EDB83DRAFT_2599557 [Lactarius deliciosus]|nr:hypothetical protein EDB83DRAFT_2527656 [Lactarius deliciosus]KAH9065118.1 hypothetical protein EDB83DRAFT_2599557 [Lactarius deliciosus]
MPRYASSFLRLGLSFQPGTTPPSPRVDPARTRDPQLTTEDGTTVTTAGHPDEPGMGSGAELWAWMGNGAAVQTSIDALHTTSHADAFLPTDDVLRLPAPARDAYTLRLCHATLPVGRVCTENLKPSRFFKLLPCCSRVGVAALLKLHRIFDAESPTGPVA